MLNWKRENKSYHNKLEGRNTKESYKVMSSRMALKFKTTLKRTKFRQEVLNGAQHWQV